MQILYNANSFIIYKTRPGCGIFFLFSAAGSFHSEWKSKERGSVNLPLKLDLLMLQAASYHLGLSQVYTTQFCQTSLLLSAIVGTFTDTFWRSENK